jgi:YebC/PmpR family DNA-binding regulatory protein
MSGHSKWAKVKHIKAVEDVKKGKSFSKHVKAIAVAARHGGGDPDFNPRLRSAILAAQIGNVPKDNIDRAVKRGTGELEGVEYHEVSYEGYGPGGVAILIEVLTDNKNRTFPELRHLFDRHGANLGQDGCVAWMFERKGFFSVPKEAAAEEKLMEVALEAGADDLKDGGDSWDVTSSPEAFETVLEALKKAGIQPSQSEVRRIPKSEVRVEADQAKKVLKFVEALEDHEDVQHVWSNFDIPDEVLQAFQG